MADVLTRIRVGPRVQAITARPDPNRSTEYHAGLWGILTAATQRPSTAVIGGLSTGGTTIAVTGTPTAT